MNLNKQNKKKTMIFLDEPNYIYRVFNTINYYLIGGYNFNNNNTNLLITLLLILLLIGTYSMLYTIFFYYDNNTNCEYISPNCPNLIFSYI